MRRVIDTRGRQWTCTDLGMPAYLRQEGAAGEQLVRVLVHCTNGRHLSLLAPPEWERTWSDDRLVEAIAGASPPSVNDSSSNEVRDR